MQFPHSWTRCARLALCGLLLAIAPLSAVDVDAATRELSRDILKQLIEINTSDSVGSTTVAAEAMAKRLRDAGFPAEDVKVLGPNARKGNMVARIHGKAGGGLKPILLIGHLDVVEARRDDWSIDPFQFVEKDGYFYGRGTQDMKDCDAIFVTAFIRLKREGFVPARDLILALTADEEGGQSNGVAWLLGSHRELIDAEFVINADGGGVTSANGRPVNVDVEASEKLYADFQLTATSPGGHSSLPVPDNAIYHLANALTRLERTPFPFELNAVTRVYFERRAQLESDQTASDMKAILHTPPEAAALARLSADARFNSTLRTTCVATRLTAGHANNALPQLAQANVNCRILPGHPAEEVRQELVRIVADPKVAVRASTDSGAISGQAPERVAFSPLMPPAEVLQPLARVADELWPGAPVIPEMETGASDSVHTIAAGMPSYGIGGVAIDQNDIRAHGKDERIRASAYYDGVEFYYRYLKALAPSR